MIQVKNANVLESMLLVPAHPRLVELLVWLAERYPIVMITGMYEERDYPSTHSTNPVRACDIRSRVFQFPNTVEVDINAHWEYDPERPGEHACAWYHNAGRGWHFHLQVHDRTRMRKRGKRYGV